MELVHKHEVTRVIVGMPLGSDGTIGRQAARVHDFVNRLARVTDIPVEFRDERLSTVSAAAYLREAGGKKHRRGVRDDAAAAAVVLQRYLDEHRSRSGDGVNDRAWKSE
jgi:putative Holliday junction resolvase